MGEGLKLSLLKDATPRAPVTANRPCPLGITDSQGLFQGEHPEAKDARALFCRYPPRFYAHAGRLALGCGGM